MDILRFIRRKSLPLRALVAVSLATWVIQFVAAKDNAGLVTKNGSAEIRTGCRDSCEQLHISGEPYESAVPVVASPSGTTYSVSHRVGADFDGAGPNPSQCFYIHNLGLPGAADDIVTFDGVAEATRTDVNGTVPTVTEGELPQPGSTIITIETSSPTGTDLFPAGITFQNTPLTDACFAIGLDDPLDWPGMDTVLAATIEYRRDGATFLGPFDVLSFFVSPWDGSIELVLPDGAGLGINGVRLDIRLHKTVSIPNDRCSDRIALTNGVYPFSTVGATTDGLDAGASCRESGYSQVDSDIWYSYVASCSGTMTVDLCNSSYDTKVAVYDGCGRCPPDAAPLECNDDFCGLRSYLTMPVVQNHCYTIRVGGYQGFQGSGNIRVACAISPPSGACCINGSCVGTMPESSCITQGGVWTANAQCGTFSCPAPENDNCEDCIRVLTNSVYTGSSTGATGEGITSCGNNSDTHDVWHCWTSDCTGLVEFSTCGSGFDTTLAVYGQCDGEELVCDDDSCAPLQSKIRMSVVSGTTYYLRVAGINGVTGSYKVNVSPCNNACCTVQGQCFNVPTTQCTNGGGTPLGSGIVCLGDHNGNNMDDVCENLCPTANIILAVPQDGIVDARQPFTPTSALPRLGIGSPGGSGARLEPVDVRINPGLTGVADCFSICETAHDLTLGTIAIQQRTFLGNGTYEFVFNRAITAGAVTTVKYRGGAGTFVDYTSHPGNVNGDGMADFFDALQLMDCCLRGLCTPAYADYSCDIDHSTRRTALDLLALLDVLNGAGGLSAWNGTQKPVNTSCP